MGGKVEQQFSFEIVSCLLAAISENGATVSAKHYKIMAQIDGTKTASGYEHLFRAVKARAKEINDQISTGAIDGSAPTPGKKAATPGKKATPGSSKKRGRKAKDADEEDDEEQGEEETPSKKHKVKQEQSADDGDDGLFDGI